MANGAHYSLGPGSIAHTIALIEDSKNTFMEWIAWAAAWDDRFKSPVDIWRQLSPVKKRICVLDDLFSEFGIESCDAIAEAARAASMHARSESQFIYALAMPKIAKRNIKEALRPKGLKDREMAMEVTGMLPQRSGVTSNVFVNAQAGAQLQNGNPSGIVSHEDDAISLTEAIRIDVREADSSETP